MEKVIPTLGLCLVVGAGILEGQAAPAPLPRPTPSPVKPFALPAVTVDTLPNGLRFALLERHDIPAVVVRIPVPGMGPNGISLVDPPGKEGAWPMLMALLHEGTSSRSADDIRSETEDLGLVTADPGPGTGFSVLSFNSSKSAWERGMALYGDMLMHPAVPADAFKRLQESYATGYFGRPTPQRQGIMAAMRGAFGTSSPYSVFPTGESIRAITRDDVMALQAEYLRPQNLLIAIGGDVTRADARAVLMRIFGGWERGGKAVAPVATVAPSAQPTTIYLADAPGSSQAVVLGLQPIPSRESAAAPAVQLVMYALGENNAIVGRMSTAFRGERGLSYSPNLATTWQPLGEPSFITATIPVAVMNADTAVMTLLQTMRAVRAAKPITEAEFQGARGYALGRLPVTLGRIDQATGTAVMAVLRDRLPRDFYNGWARRISGLTLDDVRSAAAKYVDPDHMAIAVIGDRSKIETALRATGIPVVIVDR
jgi:zinc protease